MRYYSKALSIIILTFSGFTFSLAQEPTSLQKSVDAYNEANYEAMYKLRDWSDKSANKTGWKARFNIIGDGRSYPEYNDSVFADVTYQVVGEKAVKPKFLWITMYADSRDPLKFPDDFKLMVYVDGDLLWSEFPKLEDSWTTGWTMKRFTLNRIPYEDFLKITEAKKVTFQVGQLKSDLKPEDMQRLRALNNTIER